MVKKRGIGLSLLLTGLITSCLPSPASNSQIQSITGADFKGKKIYFAFSGGDTGSTSGTVFEPMFDARNLGAVFSRSSGGKYETDITYDTTQVNSNFVLNKLDTYANSLGSDDMFIMYTGSHGSREGLYLDGNILPYEKIVDKILKFRAKEVIVFMMACHSGAFSNALTARSSEYNRWSASGRTLFILASSTADQTSSTFPSSKLEGAPTDPLNVPGNTGSAYGHVLWRAISGDADKNGDKKVTLKETYDYVVTNTVNLAQHRPTFAGDFPHNLVLTLVEGATTDSPGDTTEIDALVGKIKSLEVKIEALIVRIKELYQSLPDTNIANEDVEGSDRSDSDDSGDGADGADAVDSIPQTNPIEPTSTQSTASSSQNVFEFYLVVQKVESALKSNQANDAESVQHKSGTIVGLLSDLASALNQAVNRVKVQATLLQIRVLASEVETLNAEYKLQSELLRKKVIENLSARN